MENELQVTEDLATFINDLVFDKEQISIEIIGQTVKVENKNPSDLNIIYNDIAADPPAVFALELEFDLLGAPEDGGIGLILGWDGQSTNGSLDNYLRLLIEPTGRFSIDHFFNGQMKSIVVAESEFINQGAASNKVSVEQNGAEILFFANDQLLFTMEAIELTGTKFGLIIGPMTTISLKLIYFALPVVNESFSTSETYPEEKKEVNTDIAATSEVDITQFVPGRRRRRSKFKTFVIMLLLFFWAAGFLVYRETGLIHILLVIAILLIIIRPKTKTQPV